MINPDYSRLDAVGLNLHAVLALDRWPAPLRDRLDGERRYRQLILVGNGGPALWAAIKAEGIASPDPIDDFSVRQVERWFAVEGRGARHEIVYPGQGAIDLPALGERTGWHRPSPLMVGINAQWGTWFAYRVVVLADTDFAPTPALAGISPCLSCNARPCVEACPGRAVGGRAQRDVPEGFDLSACIAYRRRAGSVCRASGIARLARLACPVKPDLRYSGEQLRHSYSISLRLIERYC